MSSFTSCICLLMLVQGVNGRAFLGANPALQAAAVRQELQGVLSEVLGAGHGVDSKELLKIKAFLSPMFRALPKNLQGRVSAPVMRYIVQRYFSGRYGWIIRGFEPHAQTANASSDNATILQSKLPEYVRTALEEKFAHNGFALDDTAMMVAAVERLSFDEVIRGVETSYYLNNLQTTSSLSHAMLTEVLSSYLIIEMLEGKYDNIEVHQDDKIHVREIYPSWDDAFVFTQDMVKNDGYEKIDRQNPFLNHDAFTFEDVTRIAQRLSNDFGAASNHECTAIKDKLALMDVHATGRVKLSDFYKRTSQDSNEWEFGESVDYLRSLGALDESDSLFGPQVLIPNYVSGLSNCVTSAAYYSVCCVNECEKVYQHLEKDISGPETSAATILESLDAMPTPESNINSQVRTRLEEIAAYHRGTVPLHGRLFAQWLHYAFPRDCPYPHVAGTVNPETPLRWEDTGGTDSTIVTQEEVERYIKSESARIAPSPEAGNGMWSLHETLLESSTPSDSDAGSLRKVLRSIASFGMLGSLVLMLKKFMPQVQDVVPRKTVEYDV